MKAKHSQEGRFPYGEMEMIGLLDLDYIIKFQCFVFQLVGQFIARAVADGILSKSYIEGYKGKVDCEHAR